MRGRPKRVRKITSMPEIQGFRPFGLKRNARSDRTIFLLFEEYEAIRLSDYENYSQLVAADIMGISRPTYSRICTSARQKIAQALVEGSQIIVQGGSVKLDNNWHVCKVCGAIFNNTALNRNVKCALCGNTKVSTYHQVDAPNDDDEASNDDFDVVGNLVSTDAPEYVEVEELTAKPKPMNASGEARLADAATDTNGSDDNVLYQIVPKPARKRGAQHRRGAR